MSSSSIDTRRASTSGFPISRRSWSGSKWTSFAYGTPTALAAKRATSTIPIVFAAVSDPLTAGLVATLTRPGGNVTGVTLNNPELSAKRLSLLKEVVPTATRVTILGDPDFPATSSMVAETRLAARSLGIELQVLEARGPNDFDTAFSAMAKARAGALIIFPSPMFYVNYRRLVDLAAEHRLPAMYVFREAVEAGGLMCYGADIPDLFRHAATYVAKILKGARPADLPVEQPTKFELVINLKTAKALGLTIPQSLLLRADEIIQ